MSRSSQSRSESSLPAKSKQADKNGRQPERGYALVALLALMTLLAIAMMAAVPSARQQNLRELEQEAIYRGEEVAEAIRLYVRYKGTLPKSMDELLEGVAPPGSPKKIQILRASAARDPLSSTGEWRLIQPNSRELVRFQQKVMEYANGRMPETSDPALKQFAVQITGLVKLDTKEDPSDKDEGGEDTSTNANVPFIGVASRSRRDSVLYYYDIDHHHQWVFTPLFK